MIIVRPILISSGKIAITVAAGDWCSAKADGRMDAL